MLWIIPLLPVYRVKADIWYDRHLMIITLFILLLATISTHLEGKLRILRNQSDALGWGYMCPNTMADLLLFFLPLFFLLLHFSYFSWSPVILSSAEKLPIYRKWLIQSETLVVTQQTKKKEWKCKKRMMLDQNPHIHLSLPTSQQLSPHNYSSFPSSTYNLESDIENSN